MKRKALIALAPLVFFGALLLSRVHMPSTMVFDEIHYVPAAKALAELKENINWVHPPGAKIIMGGFWLVFTKWLGLLGEPQVFRVIAVFFGLWSLWAVRAIMLALGFSPLSAIAAVWLTGFNFLWFVQAKTAMLDIFYIAPSLWGFYEVWHPERRSRYAFWWGWIWLGVSFSCKWAAAPFIALAFFFGSGSWAKRFSGGLVALAVYVASFLPLGFIEKEPIPITQVVAYHQRMLNGFGTIAAAGHPYRSEWWQWPTLVRPMWYTFESNGTTETCIWASGNPVLFAVALPFFFIVIWYAIRRHDRTARILALLYWVPLLFWALTPRKLQMYYYYLAPSYFAGPMVVWAHHKFHSSVRQTRGWLLFGFTLLCAVAFLYFLPVMDARPLKPGRYLHYMWFRSWI